MRLDITKYPINACLAAILASIAASAAAADHADAGFLPADSLNPKLAAPIDTWDEAIPLGNGLLGNRQRHERLQRARSLLGVSGPTPVLELEPPHPSTPPTSACACCPFCHQPTLVLLRQVPPVRHARSLPVLDSS